MLTDSESIPPRARQHWFQAIEYAQGMKIELPFDSEEDALRAALHHLESQAAGIAKVGYYGFRARVIVYGEVELHELAARCC